MEQEQIIPTRGKKSRIPPTLSYPIGAKEISEALLGVPQLGELEIHFWYYRWIRDLEAGKSYPIIQVRYSGPRFRLGAPWEIRVDPVPRNLLHVVHTKIVAEALPAIRLWLLANPHSTEREGGHGLIFSFDALSNELSFKEHANIEWQTPRA